MHQVRFMRHVYHWLTLEFWIRGLSIKAYLMLAVLLLVDHLRVELGLIIALVEECWGFCFILG